MQPPPAVVDRHFRFKKLHRQAAQMSCFFIGLYGSNTTQNTVACRAGDRR